MRCAEAAPNAQRGERQKPAEFKRGLVIPRKLLGAGTSSTVGATIKGTLDGSPLTFLGYHCEPPFTVVA